MMKIYEFYKSKTWRKGFVFLILIYLMGTQGCIPEDNRIFRVGVLCGNNLVWSTVNGFKSKMDKLGYHEGRNILYDIQKTNFDPGGEKQIIERFVGEKVDLIFAFPHDAALTAKNMTQGTDIPVIFAYANIGDINFVESLRKPGGNITGVQHQLDILTVKRFELLLEFDPGIQKIWVAYDFKNTVFPSALKALREAAQSKKVSLEEVNVTNLEGIKADLAMREEMSDLDIDAILIMPDQLIQTRECWDLIKDFAHRHKLPISANVYSQMIEGALFHYGNDYAEVGEKAATLADKILQGIPPSELPVLSPEEYLRINMVAAEALNLSVPDGLLKRAVEIIH